MCNEENKEKGFEIRCKGCGEDKQIQLTTDLITKDVNIMCMECKNAITLVNPNFDKDSTDKNLYNMGMGDVLPVNDSLCVLRVPGGWIYNFDADRGIIKNTGRPVVDGYIEKYVFVPFSDEYLVADYSNIGDCNYLD